MKLHANQLTDKQLSDELPVQNIKIVTGKKF